MPKGTYHKCEQLALTFMLEGTSLINTLPQPFLTAHVPVINLTSNMFGCLYFYWIACLNSIKILASIFVFLIADSRGMNSSKTKFPGKIIFTFQEGNT